MSHRFISKPSKSPSDNIVHFSIPTSNTRARPYNNWIHTFQYITEIQEYVAHDRSLDHHRITAINLQTECWICYQKSIDNIDMAEAEIQMNHSNNCLRLLKEEYTKCTGKKSLLRVPQEYLYEFSK